MSRLRNTPDMERVEDAEGLCMVSAGQYVAGVMLVCARVCVAVVVVVGGTPQHTPTHQTRAGDAGGAVIFTAGAAQVWLAGRTDETMHKVHGAATCVSATSTTTSVSIHCTQVHTTGNHLFINTFSLPGGGGPGQRGMNAGTSPLNLS